VSGVSGHGQMEWVGSDFRYEYTYQHWVFLRLPSPMLRPETTHERSAGFVRWPMSNSAQ